MSKPRAASAPAAHGGARALKRSASPSPLRRIAAAVTALVLGSGLALVAVAAPASAHHNTINGTVTCDPSTSTYDITWTVENSEAKTETVTDSSNTDLVPVGTTFDKRETRTFVQHDVVEGSYTLTLSTEWSNEMTATNSATVTAEGDCDADAPVKKIEFCHATGSATNPYVRTETSVSAFFKAGHIDHQDHRDIYPAFTYLKHGKLIEVPAQGDQALLKYEDCTLPPATIQLPAEPEIVDMCGVDRDRIVAPVDSADVSWTTSPIVDGTATATASVKPGFTFSNGKTSETWTFEFDDAECVDPTLEVAVATGRCVADAPWIFYDIELTDPDHKSTSTTANLVLTDGTHIETIVLGELVDGKLEGKALWPGASVAADGVTPTGWPGWKLVGTTWVQVDDNFAWTRGDIEATIEVNPTAAVSLVYPQATPECATGPKGSGSGSSPAAAGTGLASTGFAGTTIAIVAGIIVVAGVAFLVIARMRRKRS